MDDGALRISARDGRRQGILEVARQIFLEEGFADASMSAIATRVGGSKGTLYNYFPSKQDLFAAVILDECDRKQAALFDTLNTHGDDLRAVLTEVGERYTHLVLGDDSVQLSRVVIAESTRFPELGRVLFEAGPKRGRLRLATYLQGQVDAGRLRTGNAMRVAEQFCDMCLGGLWRQRLMNLIPMPEAAVIADNVQAAVQVVMAAYAAPLAGG